MIARDVVALGEWLELPDSHVRALADRTQTDLRHVRVLVPDGGEAAAVLFLSCWSVPPDWMDQMPIAWQYLDGATAVIVRPWPDLTHDPDRDCFGCRRLAPDPHDPSVAWALDLSCTDADLAASLIGEVVGVRDTGYRREITGDWSAE